MRPPAGMTFTNIMTNADLANNEVRFAVDVESVIHHCPTRGSGLTPCCERSPFDLPVWDRLTLRAEDATCTRHSEQESALCTCPPGPCLGWAFDAEKCRATEAHTNTDRADTPASARHSGSSQGGSDAS